MMLLFWLMVIGVIAWLAVALRRRNGGDTPKKDQEDQAESVLRQRYARDEMDEETYRRKLEELRRS